jgi:hypothetical protein
MDSPTQLRWLLTLEGQSAAAGPSFDITTPVIGHWPAVTPTAVPAALQQALQAHASGAAPSPVGHATATLAPARLAMTLWLGALLGAFLGGLLLNLMPCVFPILAIKVLGFAQPGHSRRQPAATAPAAPHAPALSPLPPSALLQAAVVAKREAERAARSDAELRRARMRATGFMNTMSRSTTKGAA